MSGMRPRPMKPMYTDPRVARATGRQAIEDIGYTKIIQLAVEKGWLRYPPKRDTSNLIGQVPPPQPPSSPPPSPSPPQEAGFLPVFTEYAVVAGLTAQADSPAPGPADAVGVGILVVGLIDAGILGGMLLRYIESPPAPTNVASVGAAAAGVAAAAGAVSVAGAEAVRRKKEEEKKNECQEELNKCLLTDLNDEDGHIHGSKRCAMCFGECKAKKGTWPSRMKITNKMVSCEYWKPKGQR